MRSGAELEGLKSAAAISAPTLKGGPSFTLTLIGLAWLLLGSTLLPPPAGGVALSGTSLTTLGSGPTQTCLDGVGPRLVNASEKVALLQPIFTATPYSQYVSGSFYRFYQTFRNVTGNITSDLALLQTPISSGQGYDGGWGLSYPLYEFMKSASARSCGLDMGSNVSPVSDVDITQGALFSANGTRRYDAVVVGFEEYATIQEYQQLREFVASGGRLVIMSGDALEVRVNYNSTTGVETYVIGHGFAFDGMTAWKTSDNPWHSSNDDWVGSNKCCFGKYTYTGASLNLTNPLGKELAGVFGQVVFGEYSSHEEAGLTNLTQTSIIATFVNRTDLVTAYAHRYVRGEVVCLCVFADDIISRSPSAQYFLVLAVASGDLGIPPPVECCHQPSTGLILVLAAGVASAVALASAAGYLWLRRRGRRRGSAPGGPATGNVN